MQKRIFAQKTSSYLIRKGQEMQWSSLLISLAAGGVAGGMVGCFLALWINLLSDTQLSILGTFVISMVPGAWMGGIIGSMSEE